MARNRVIYQSEALYVSDDANSAGSADHTQLHRVQSANYSFNISRQDVNQYGQVGRIDSLILEAPTVSFDASYYLHDGSNEVALGFADSDDFTVGFASGHMTAGSGKNFYILQSDDGVDANETTGNKFSSVIGIGNAYLTDYTLDASVGSIPTVSVSYEGLNINSTSDITGGNSTISGIDIPSVELANGTKIGESDVNIPTPTTGTVGSTALRPGDIAISFGAISSNASLGPIVDIGGGTDGSHVQSVSLNFSLSRTPIERIGNLFPYARPADFPATASFNVSAIVNEITAANLVDIVESGHIGTDIDLTFKGSDGSTVVSAYKLKNAKLVSESISSSIGSNKTVDLTFDVSIGGPSDATNNIFMSGSVT
jgi:hypothetical protein